MSKRRFLAALPLLAVALVACSDDEDTNPSTVDGADSGVAPDASTDKDSGAPREDASTPDEDSGSEGPRCTAAAETLLKPIDAVSTGEVTVTATEGTVKTVYVDGSAGGTQASATNPRIYVNLETLTRVDVTDKTAATSSAWDLAIKRPVLFTNGGDGGGGQGQAARLTKDFDAVTAADAAGASFNSEVFFDDDCNPQVDEAGAVMTSFSGWYDYDEATHVVTPGAGTWLVKGATGKLFKLQILRYNSNPDGTEGTATGRFLFKVGAL